MMKLFTVRWPILARLDAILMFPVALFLASGVARIQAFVIYTLAPAMPAVAYHFGLSNQALYWFDLALAGFVPYVALLIMADRMLTMRKGYAMLSILVVATWATAATGLPPGLEAYVPRAATALFRDLPFQQQAALTVGGLALIVHLRPLFLGLRDRGEVATRLIEGPDLLEARRDIDPYLRNTADFRTWRIEDQSQEIMTGQRESSGLKLLFGIAWVSVILTVGLVYYHSTSTNVAAVPMVIPGVRGSQPSGGATMHPAAMPPSQSALQFTPETLSADENVIAIPGLPAVQRPSGSVGGWDAGNGYGGPNEAVATRARDGSFGFDAVINGAHVPMLFDTGATVVALRAEDVGRFGIAVPTLNYSAKVKTANGTAEAAPIVIDTLTVGNITQRHVLGYVAKEGVLPKNLLGQSFLARLSGYNVENNQLILKGR